MKLLVADIAIQTNLIPVSCASTGRRTSTSVPATPVSTGQPAWIRSTASGVTALMAGEGTSVKPS